METRSLLRTAASATGFDATVLRAVLPDGAALRAVETDLPAVADLRGADANLPVALDFRAVEADLPAVLVLRAVEADLPALLVLRVVEADLPTLLGLLALNAEFLVALGLLAVDVVLPAAVVFLAAEPNEAVLSLADAVFVVVFDFRAVEVAPFFAAGFSLSRKRSVSRFRGNAVDFFFSVIVPLRMNLYFQAPFCVGRCVFSLLYGKIMT